MSKVLETKETEDFKKEKKVFAFLHLEGQQRVVGTTPIKEIKYKSDYDIQSYNNFKNKPEAYELVYQMFKEKFNEAYNSTTVWITDMKCGNIKSIPIRWDLQSVNDGYKIIDDVKYNFIDCLKQKSMVKMDILALIDDVLNEFSEVYMLSFGKNANYFSELTTIKQLKIAIYSDALDYKGQGKYYKSLKRLFAYLRLDELANAKKIKKLLNWFNSPIGELATVKNDIEELKLLITQKFRPVDDIIIKKQIKYIKDLVSNEYKELFQYLDDATTREQLIISIDELNEQINEIVQLETLQFINKNKSLYRIARNTKTENVS